MLPMHILEPCRTPCSPTYHSSTGAGVVRHHHRDQARKQILRLPNSIFTASIDTIRSTGMNAVIEPSRTMSRALVRRCGFRDVYCAHATATRLLVLTQSLALCFSPVLYRYQRATPAKRAVSRRVATCSWFPSGFAGASRGSLSAAEPACRIHAQLADGWPWWLSGGRCVASATVSRARGHVPRGRGG